MSLTTYDANEQEVSLNVDINIAGMSGTEATVAISPRKVCPLDISWLGNLTGRSERSGYAGKEKNPTTLPIINHRLYMTRHHIWSSRLLCLTSRNVY